MSRNINNYKRAAHKVHLCHSMACQNSRVFDRKAPAFSCGYIPALLKILLQYLFDMKVQQFTG